MSVEYSARLVVGLPYGELKEWFNFLDDFWDYEEHLDQVSPYFDADKEDCLYGVVVKKCNDYSYSEVDEKSFPNDVQRAHKKFKDVTGKEGKLYLSAYGH